MRLRRPLRRVSGGEGGARRVSDGRVRWLAPLVALLLSMAPALAVEPSEMLSDPALELRAREISRELRCVVCQNESVDDSPAEVAHDIRRAVRERLVAGDTDRQVLDYMVGRYGDYVLLDPPFKARMRIGGYALHRQSLISGKSSPCSSTYSLCSMSLSRSHCLK